MLKIRHRPSRILRGREWARPTKMVAMDIVRGQRLARVKFVALQMDGMPGDTREARNGNRLRRVFPGEATLRFFLSRVIGRLVAARP